MLTTLAARPGKWVLVREKVKNGYHYLLGRRGGRRARLGPAQARLWWRKATKKFVKPLERAIPSPDADAYLEAEMQEADAFLQRCVPDVMKTGKSKSQAFAICTATGQKAGYYKAGSKELTAKGKKAVKKHTRKPDMASREAEYEKAIDRKSPKRGMAEANQKEDFRRLDKAVKVAFKRFGRVGRPAESAGDAALAVGGFAARNGISKKTLHRWLQSAYSSAWARLGPELLNPGLSARAVRDELDKGYDKVKKRMKRKNESVDSRLPGVIDEMRYMGGVSPVRPEPAPRARNRTKYSDPGEVRRLAGISPSFWWERPIQEDAQGIEGGFVVSERPLSPPVDPDEARRLARLGVDAPVQEGRVNSDILEGMFDALDPRAFSGEAQKEAKWARKRVREAARLIRKAASQRQVLGALDRAKNALVSLLNAVRKSKDRSMRQVVTGMIMSVKEIRRSLNEARLSERRLSDRDIKQVLKKKGVRFKSVQDGYKLANGVLIYWDDTPDNEGWAWRARKLGSGTIDSKRDVLMIAEGKARLLPQRPLRENRYQTRRELAELAEANIEAILGR